MNKIFKTHQKPLELMVIYAYDSIISIFRMRRHLLLENTLYQSLNEDFEPSSPIQAEQQGC